MAHITILELAEGFLDVMGKKDRERCHTILTVGSKGQCIASLRGIFMAEHGLPKTHANTVAAVATNILVQEVRKALIDG